MHSFLDELQSILDDPEADKVKKSIPVASSSAPGPGKNKNL